MITFYDNKYYNFLSQQQSASVDFHRKHRTKEESIRDDIGEEAFDYISNYFSFGYHSKILATTTLFNIENLNDNYYNAIVNLKSINDYGGINDIIVEINHKLRVGGKFIGWIETKNLRKKRLLNKFKYPFNWIYYSGDFVFKRVFPKFRTTRKIYNWITQDRNRVITKTEVLGRLAYCNFNIISEKIIGNRLYFIAEKLGDVNEEHLRNPDPYYGIIIRLKRLGKNGKPFYVYKLRTMHPFAEYIQDYIYRNNHLDKGGKFKNDFRISSWGRGLRKYWVDELPMLINLLKGDMKIVGVRPLSSQYYNLYNNELKERRIKTKPGLIPPYYADMPDTLEEIIESELRYLDCYEKNPLKTDFIYLCRALKNIVFNSKRSG